MGATQSVPDVNLENKVAIVTGGNTGLGFETAKELSRKGCRVIIACRDQSKADGAVQKLKEELPNANIEVMALDLSSLESVRHFAKEYKEKNLPLHLLINNAGVMALPKRETTKDGFEMQMGVNHLGHFLLTNLLLEDLKRSAPSRIVNLTSFGHAMSNMDWNDFLLEKKGAYGPWRAYGNSKLANILFTRELQKRLEGTDVTTYAVHPGWVHTELSRHTSTPGFYTAEKYLAKTPFQGALTTLYCAMSPEALQYNGGYFADCHHKTPFAAARNDESAKKLWEISEKLTNLHNTKSEQNA